MKTVAIICEYNPFHSGHKYQIDTIKKELGEDTRIIAIMSGNYTQRASLAFAPKSARAKWAIDCGVNLVLELPFPYSMASAEFFARAGVAIADKLGIVDVLSFGSESADVTELTQIARNMTKQEYFDELSRLSDEHKNSAIGHPRLAELAYISRFGAPGADISLPNNILAIEYLKALLLIGSSIAPHTVKRSGAGYNDEKLTESAAYQSATAIRRALTSSNYAALEALPPEVAAPLKAGLDIGAYPADEEAISSAIISHFLLNNASAADIHDADGGLYNRIAAMSREATSISSLCELSNTKKYTSARIRRAIWFSFFGVTSSDVKSSPLFTRVLAADQIGTKALKEIKKRNGISVITKPSSEKDLSSDALKLKELSDRADLIYQLALPKKAPPADALRSTPYIKK